MTMKSVLTNLEQRNNYLSRLHWSVLWSSHAEEDDGTLHCSMSLSFCRVFIARPHKVTLVINWPSLDLYGPLFGLLDEVRELHRLSEGGREGLPTRPLPISTDIFPLSTYGPYSASWDKWGLASLMWSVPATTAFLSWWLEDRRWWGTSERSSGRWVGVEAGLRCMLWGEVSICGAGCGDEVGGVEGLSIPTWGMTVGKCCSLVEAGGLLWLTGLWNEAAPSEACGGSELSVTGLSAGAPLQCMVLCLLNMAERVKLFPQALQMYGFSPVCDRMWRCRSPEPMKHFPTSSEENK